MQPTYSAAARVFNHRGCGARAWTASAAAIRASISASSSARASGDSAASKLMRHRPAPGSRRCGGLRRSRNADREATVSVEDGDRSPPGRRRLRASCSSSPGPVVGLRSFLRHHSSTQALTRSGSACQTSQAWVRPSARSPTPSRSAANSGASPMPSRARARRGCLATSLATSGGSPATGVVAPRPLVLVAPVPPVASGPLVAPSAAGIVSRRFDVFPLAPPAPFVSVSMKPFCSALRSSRLTVPASLNPAAAAIFPRGRPSDTVGVGPQRERVQDEQLVTPQPVRRMLDRTPPCEQLAAHGRRSVRRR